MTARVLVVDDILANVRLLEAKLTAEYFEVVTAMNGLDALEAIQRTKPDIILLDVMMPGIDGIEVCKRIKANPNTQHIPVVMVTALDQPEDRVRGLEAGADDFLTKPVNDISLFCRVKSLVRLKMLSDELRLRATSADAASVIFKSPADFETKPGNVMVVDPKSNSAERIKATLKLKHNVIHIEDPLSAPDAVSQTKDPVELIVINMDYEAFDGLRLCSQLKSLQTSRQIPILIIVDPDDQPRLLRALDMGVNDYLMRPIDRQELAARVNTQIKRWRFTEQLRMSVKASLEMAVTDSLTGLYNRRYLETHLAHLVDHSVNRGKALSVLTIDVDFFKAVNDTYGHGVGDKVLQELSSRIRANTRSMDLCCRTGGEEFVLILPTADLELANKIAERLRKAVAGRPFAVGLPQGINVTVSIGVSTLGGIEDSQEALLTRSDEALYRAKREGRNRVVQWAA
jgi:two-component system, cell cycle response regulator